MQNCGGAASINAVKVSANIRHANIFRLVTYKAKAVPLPLKRIWFFKKTEFFYFYYIHIYKVMLKCSMLQILNTKKL